MQLFKSCTLIFFIFISIAWLLQTSRLFTIINISRFLGVSGEDALRRANRKFIHRFHGIEEELKLRGKTIDDSSLEEMSEIWDTIKKDDLISLSNSQ